MEEKILKLEDLGWDEIFQSNRKKLGLDDFAVARVIAQNRGSYRVKNAEGEFLAKVTGKQMFQAESREDYPAVGDWVAIVPLDGEQAKIQAILPRKTIIQRRFGDRNRTGEKNDVQVIAANIDVAFLVQSAVGRDYSLNRFERYMTIAKESGVTPVIILNKTDLMMPEELNLKIEEIKNRLGEIVVMATSTIDNIGLEKLKDYIEKGKTYCFLGSSGVGKSSLINKLLGKDDIKTGNISVSSDRGKHVTTAREMYFLDEGGILIDNPGIREVGMTDTLGGITDSFSEISALGEMCKFADCTHTHEPGCEILNQLKSGKLDEGQYENFIRLKKEAAYFGMDEAEKRQKNRQFGKFIKKAKKELSDVGHKDY